VWYENEIKKVNTSSFDEYPNDDMISSIMKIISVHLTEIK
jgi:hypothetical protein